MHEKIIKSAVFLLLLVNGILDWRKGEVSLVSLALFGAAGIGLNVWLGYQSFLEAAGGAGLGVLLLLTAFLTREAIGFGDGLLLLVTGIYLGFWENLNLLFLGAVLSAVILGAGMLANKVKLKDRVPLVPFLLLGFIGRLFL